MLFPYRNRLIIKNDKLVSPFKYSNLKKKQKKCWCPRIIAFRSEKNFVKSPVRHLSLTQGAYLVPRDGADAWATEDVPAFL